MSVTVIGNKLKVEVLADESTKTQLNEMQQEVRDLDERVDTIIAGTVEGVSGAEIVDARDGEVTLGANITKVKSQLVESATKIAEVNSENKNTQHDKRKAVVTFITDDGSIEDWNKLKPLSETYNIPMVSAIITSYPGGINSDYEKLKYLQNNLGWEIASHTHTHPYLPDKTETEIEQECKISKETLLSKGLKVKSIVYPGGGNDEKTRRIAKKYYRSGISVSYSAGTNTDFIPSFNIKRVGVGSNFDSAVSGLPATNTLEYYKARVDQAFAEGSWLIFMLHPGDENHTATQQGYLETLIQYVQSKSIPVMTLDKAFDIFGNAVEFGDYNRSSTGVAIDKQGNVVNFPNNMQIISKTGKSASSPVVDFPKGVISATTFLSTDSGDFPTSVGTLLTYRLNNDDELSFQVWHDYFRDAMYKRRWRTAGWESWSEYATKNYVDNNQFYHILFAHNEYSADQPITAYPNGKITTIVISGADGAVGYPGAGYCTTYRFGGKGWDRQEFRKHNTNEIWGRYVSDDDGTWTPWVKMSAV